MYYGRISRDFCYYFKFIQPTGKNAEEEHVNKMEGKLMQRAIGFILISLAIIAAFYAGAHYSGKDVPGALIIDTTSEGPSQVTTGTALVPPPTATPEPEIPKPHLQRCAPFIFDDDLDPEDLKIAIKNSLKYYEGVLDGQNVMFGDEAISKERVTDTLQSVLTALDKMGFSKEFFSYINENYTFYQTSAEKVLFTGYYLASLNGSPTQTAKYKYPLYKKPDDLCLVYLNQFDFYQKLLEENPHMKGLPGQIKGRLVNKTIVPYYSKMDIDYGNKLKGKGLEFVWVDSPVDRFFLQVQGSGIVQFENGENMRVNYAESNGRTYESIGKMLIAKGILTEENVSMKTIREYLQKNPDQIKPVLTHDPSYVFFRSVKDGPYGCFGVPVTTYRSIATDRKCFPAAALAIIKTEKPIFDKNGEITGWKPFTRFVCNQDTGGAIKSPARVDLYCGFGKSNEVTAGHMKQDGTIFFILKNEKEVTEPNKRWLPDSK